MIRKAKAVWRGTGRAGTGQLSTDSGVLAETPYSFRTRFENEKGTNPNLFYPNVRGLAKSERAVYEYLGELWSFLRGKV